MTNEDLIAHLLRENKEQKAVNTDLNATIARLNKTIVQLNKTIVQLNETSENQAQLIASLQKTIDDLKAQIARLEEKNNKNSRNSSKPPSSDGLKKPPANNRKPSGRKAGAQKGHPGSYLMMDAEPTEVIQHKPSLCEQCPYWDKCKETAYTAETRKTVDIVVETKVTAHETLEVPCCPLTGESQQGSFPENIKATIQYGDNLQALVSSLNTTGAVSVKRIHEILMGVFNVPISTGTIRNIVHRCAEAVGPAYDRIREEMISAELSHFDETGTRLEGKTAWVHDASNAQYTYLDISRKRGFEGMEECGVLPGFHGIAVHDCWSPYWRYTGVKSHAVCCAHLLRELTGIIENNPDQIWAKSMSKHLLKMKKAKDKAIRDGKEKLSDSYLKQFSRIYDNILQAGKIQNPVMVSTEKKRGRKKKGKIRSLIDRLEEYKASVCLFVNDFSVPFDNNQAERDIRMIKTKTKVSGCFRSTAGAKDYLKIMSYVGTAHKRGLNAYNAIRKALAGTPEFIFQ